MADSKWVSFVLEPGDGKTAGDFWNYLRENKWNGEPFDFLDLAKEGDSTLLWPIVTARINAQANHNIAWIPFKVAA